MSSGYIVLFRNRETKQVLVTSTSRFEDLYENDDTTQVLFCQYVGDVEAAQQEIDDTIDLFMDPGSKDANVQLANTMAMMQDIANGHPPTTFRPV